MPSTRYKVPGILIIACLSATPPARATAQEPDRLLMDGREYFILTNPLEPFLALNPEKRPTSEVFSTASWRGYLATWRIDRRRVNLIKVEVFRSKNTTDDSFETEYGDATDAVFPGQVTVFAEWFTGHIVIPTGDLVEYVHMGYASTYKQYLLLRVERGMVVKEERLSLTMFEKFREAQFAAFSQTSQYQAEFEKMKKEGKRSDSEIRSFLSRYYSEQYLRAIWDAGLNK